MDGDMESPQERAENPNHILVEQSMSRPKFLPRTYQQTSEQVQCRQLAHAMSTALPRELRNQIYTYLTCGNITPQHPTYSGKILVLDNAFPSSALSSGDAHEDDWQMRQFHSSTKACTKYDSILLSKAEYRENLANRNCNRHQLTGRVYDVAYVGETFAREAVETYYTTNTFHIHHGNPGRGLYRLFTWKGLRFNVIPHSFIRNIHVDIRLRDFVPSTRWSVKEGRDERRKLNYLHGMLMKSFALVECKERLHVHFVVTCNFTPHGSKGARCQNEWSLLNVLEALREPVYMLMHAGARVVFLYSDDRGVLLDKTKIFHLNKEEWQQERQNNIEQGNEYHLEMQYIARQEKSMRNGKHFQLEIEEMLVQVEDCRRRWGYESWSALVYNECNKSLKGTEVVV